MPETVGDIKFVKRRENEVCRCMLSHNGVVVFLQYGASAVCRTGITDTEPGFKGRYCSAVHPNPLLLSRAVGRICASVCEPG